MPTLLLALILLDTPPSPAPPSPAPAIAEKKRQTLAEVAAKGAPARKKGAPAKVLTNEDLDKARAGGAAVSVLAADGVEPVGGGGGSEGSDRTSSSNELGIVEEVSRDEATWRQRAEAARMRITEAQAVVAQGEQRLAGLRNDVAPDDPMNPFRQQTRETEIKAEAERLEEARAQVALARQALSDLEDEARRAAIPPGWLREP